MPGELRRVLGLRDLVLIVVGTTIGSGIFLVPGAVLRQSGSDLGVALLVWVVGSVLALLGALTFGELGAMLPDAGGSYVYVREAFGPLPAFLLGWTLFLAISTGSTATLAVAFANYLGELAPLGPVTRKLVGVAMIGAVAADRKSTRLNSSHGYISYAVFCLKKKRFLLIHAGRRRAITRHLPYASR